MDNKDNNKQEYLQEDNKYNEQNNKIIDKSFLSKNEIVDLIKDWLKIEEDIKILKKNLNIKNKNKKEITDVLVKFMNTQNIDSFNMNNGSIIHKKKTIKKTISSKFLLEKLKEYHDDIQTAEQMFNFIQNKREVKNIDEIKHKL